MKATTEFIPATQDIPALYKAHLPLLSHNDSENILKLRNEAAAAFSKLGFPLRDQEEWRSTSLEDALRPEYKMYLEPDTKPVDINNIFRCEIHNFETFMFTQLNGWYIYNNAPLTVLDNGTVVGSLAAAMKAHPELFARHYGKYAPLNTEGLAALNTMFAQDGIFISVPDGVELEKPIQMVNIVNMSENVFMQPRNLIILGKNSKLTLVHCDDSIRHQTSFINAVSEIFLDEGSSLDYYKLQNKDDKSTVINNNYFHLLDNSSMSSTTLTLNGGLLRNETHVDLNGSGCNADVNGLYLMDRKQHVDNQVHLNHLKPGSRSSQLFKGIIDDDASAAFNGYINVARDAQRTEAYQSNKNILLTDTARVHTKPFLEIYADDVKCSHGATVGQLDPEAMFYLRSRGICERNARMLLMYAFAADVANRIRIPLLRERIDNMIQKRLRGELSICDQCVLHCNEERSVHFDIDLSKI